MTDIQFYNSGRVYNNFRVILVPKILTLYLFLLYIAEMKPAGVVYGLVFVCLNSRI